MLFNSFEFILFFIIITIGFFLLPHKHRWWWLLAASTYFYAFFKWYYLGILVFTIIIDYYAGIWINQSVGIRRKWALGLSLAANIGVLALFKYYYFIIDVGNRIQDLFNIGKNYEALWQFALPVGLSFHTFQAMSYTIEVYRGHQKVERNFGIYALYVMFYPQLVAGPIERPQNILHQFYEKHSFDFHRVASGLRLMLWGMFKKVVIADNISVYVDHVYGNLGGYTGFPVILAAILYSFQIFCDFSGYSDIAIGSARVMGFTLMKNFNRPYYTRSISEFWSRWHISLSTWFRDYLYIPLGGNRVVLPRYYLNLFIVFMASGLWHGASYNFIIWGALHGIFLIFGHITRKPQEWLTKLLPGQFLKQLIHIFITFVLVSFAWLFFRLPKLHNVIEATARMIQPSSNNMDQLISQVGSFNFYGIFLGIFIMESVHLFQENRNVSTWLDNLSRWQRWSCYYVILAIILIFGYYGKVQFIYFQF